jgi:signal transduction histidine kinase
MTAGVADRRLKQAEKLHALLSAMADGLDELYGCLRDQQACLLRWNLAGFLETVRRQQRLAQENLQREKERRMLVAEMVGEERSESVTLRQISEELEQDWPVRFQALAKRLRSSSGKAADMKKQNESLISHSHRLVNDRIKLLLDLARINRNLYEPSGKKSKKSNLHKVLDRKA